MLSSNSSLKACTTDYGRMWKHKTQATKTSIQLSLWQKDSTPSIEALVLMEGTNSRNKATILATRNRNRTRNQRRNSITPIHPTTRRNERRKAPVSRVAGKDIWQEIALVRTTKENPRSRRRQPPI